MTPLLARDDVSVYHATWRDLLDVVPECDLLCVDAPYSERTHKGHDSAVASTERLEGWAKSSVDEDNSKAKRKNRANEKRYAARGNTTRASLEYAFWTADDVNAFVDAWAARTRGWFCSLTDTELAPVWKDALERSGRLTFSPIACVEPGSRVRLTGDGPAQWSVWLVVARPRAAKFSKWGALPGAYVVPSGHNPRAMNGGKAVTGGKPLWLMERIIEDYSRAGDLVCDPCAGGGTTLLAALRTGRRAVGGDQMLEHAKLAAKAAAGPVQRPLLVASVAREQLMLGGNHEGL